MRCNITPSSAFSFYLLPLHHQGHAARRDVFAMLMTASSKSRSDTHVDIHDRVARSALAERLGVDDARLRKAARIVGSRITSITAYLRK